MHIWKNSKQPKTALGIIISGFLVLSLYCLKLPDWFWIDWEIAGAVLVAYGCAGEWNLEETEGERLNKEEKHHKHRLGIRYIKAVTFGVTMELIGLGYSIPQAKKQDREIAFLQTSNAWIWQTNLQLQFANLVLQSNVYALQLQIIETSNNVVKIDPLTT